MLGAAGIAMAVATACFAAAAARFNSLVSTLLAAYLALVANVGLVTLSLSPTRSGDAGRVAVAEAVLLAVAVGGWWLRGRPGLALAARASAAVRMAFSDPVTVAFLAAVGVLLVYEGLLALLAAEQHGLAHLPPHAGGRLGAARRDLLDPERTRRWRSTPTSRSPSSSSCS